MDSSIDNKVEILASIFSFGLLIPTVVVVVAGSLVGVAMFFWSFSSKSKSITVDYFGLTVCCALLLLYFLMPIGLELSDRNEPLDVMRHGFFGVADLYTWILFCVVCLVVSTWTIARVYLQRKSNFGVSLFLYAVINLAAIFIGWLVASKYGGAWTS